MSKNHVQFQRGFSLSRFLKHYGEEAQCARKLFELKWPNGFVCPKCAHDACYDIKQSCRMQCRRCHHQTSLKVNTIFEHAKLSLNTWFLAIYLISQQKNSLSSLHLKRLLGVSYNTAWLMHQKLMRVMAQVDSKQKLFGRIQLDDGYIGGKKTGGKRGRGAQGKQPFIMAIRLERGQPAQLKLGVLPHLKSRRYRAVCQTQLPARQLYSSG